MEGNMEDKRFKMEIQDISLGRIVYIIIKLSHVSLSRV